MSDKPMGDPAMFSATASFNNFTRCVGLVRVGERMNCKEARHKQQRCIWSDSTRRSSDYTSVDGNVDPNVTSVPVEHLESGDSSVIARWTVDEEVVGSNATQGRN